MSTCKGPQFSQVCGTASEMSAAEALCAGHNYRLASFQVTHPGAKPSQSCAGIGEAGGTVVACCGAAIPPSGPSADDPRCGKVNSTNAPGQRQLQCNSLVDKSAKQVCFFDVMAGVSGLCRPLSAGHEGPEDPERIIPPSPDVPSGIIPNLYPDSLLFSPELSGMPAADAQYRVQGCRHKLSQQHHHPTPAAVRECANQCAVEVAQIADEPFLPSNSASFLM